VNTAKIAATSAHESMASRAPTLARRKERRFMSGFIGPLVTELK
jgi:hypothetical protein